MQFKVKINTNHHLVMETGKKMIELQLLFSCYKLKDRNHQAVSIS